MSSFDVCRPDELGRTEIARWRELQRGNRRLTNPFLTPEFAVVLSRHVADARVAVLTDDSRIVGFFPHHRRPMGVGRGLGIGIANGQAMVQAPDAEWDPKDLLRRCGLAVWEFDNLVGCQLDAFAPRHAASEPAPFIDLSRGWERWLNAKRAASAEIKEVQRKQRKLAREIGEVCFEFHSRDRDHLRLLMHWKSQQFRRTGRFDRFSWPWFAGAFEELTQTATDDFSGVLSVLSVGGQPVAIRQELCANGILAGWFSAYDGNLARYSPGHISLLELVRAAAQRGLREVDMAKGRAKYKETLKDGEHTVAEGWVERSCAVATLRRLQQAPRRRTLDFVLGRPPLRRMARTALNGVGRIRISLQGE